MSTRKLLLVITSAILVGIFLFVLVKQARYPVPKPDGPEAYSGPTIHLAAMRGDLEQVRSMIVLDPELVKARDKYGNSPLQIAAYKGHTEIVEFLLSKGGEVNATSKFGGTALYMASYAGQEEVVEVLIAHGADPNLAIKDSGEHVLQVATLEGYRNYNHIFSALGGIANVKVHFIGSPLQAASANGYKKIAEVLIANGANVNARAAGKTALHSASVNGQRELAELLIANGADVNARDETGSTPLCSAMFCLREPVDSTAVRDVAEVLIRRGADVNLKSRTGLTPLHHATAHANIETVELLISSGANINARNEDGDTPLNVACRYRRERRGGVIDLLHKNGAVRRHGKNNSYDYEPDLIK